MRKIRERQRTIKDMHGFDTDNIDKTLWVLESSVYDFSKRR